MARVALLVTVSVCFCIAAFAEQTQATASEQPAAQQHTNMAVPEADTSQLGPAPGTYTVINDRNEFLLPFTFYGMNLMVDASINGTDIKMLIDNGVMWDELLFYGSDQVDTLGMKYEGEVRVVGAGDDRSKGTDSTLHQTYPFLLAISPFMVSLRL